MSTNLTVYGGWVLRTAAALLLFVAFRVFESRYQRKYLALWAWGWLVAAIFTGTAVAGHYIAMNAPRAQGARLAISAVSGITGYVQLTLLLLGTVGFASGRALSRRNTIWVLALSAALGLVASAVAIYGVKASTWKFFWRLGIRAGVAGLVFLAAGWIAFQARGATRAIGPTLLAATLGLSGLEQLHYLVIAVGQLWGLSFPYEPQLAVLDVFLVSAVGLGMAMCLLEEERDARMQTQFQAVLEERTRIAREIHDTLAQGFVGIALQLESASETLGKNPSAAQAHLEQASSLARESLSEARQSVLRLRPEPHEPGDLAKALSSAAEERLGRPVPVLVRGRTRKLSAEVQWNLLRIGQEALVNAASHARAERVEMELRFDRHHVQLHVRDDGMGFDTEGKAPSGHFGLRGMRERAESLGGRFDLQSVPGRGTRISVRVPTKQGH